MKGTGATIRDVASLAGVSRQTVSRVLNDSGYVADGTRARVEEAMETLDYRPNAVARSMATGSTRTLGCISPSLTDYTFASIIESAQAEARRQGYFILAGSAPTEDEVEPLLDEMLHRRVDGLLIINPCADGRYRHVVPLARQGLAVVYVSERPSGEPISSVRCDDQEGGLQAGHHLIDLGHKALAVIVGPENEACSLDRLNGCREAMAQAGLTADSALTVRGDWSATSGHRAIENLLAEGRHFTAVFAQNDRMAVGAIHALRGEGYRVPQDVSVMGFDDIPLASYFDPPLTTIRQPLVASGERAADLLIQTIQHPERRCEHILTRPRLVERGSCAPHVSDAD